MADKISKINFFYREGAKEAAEWEKKILKWLGKEYPNVRDFDAEPEAILVLGGDGTILEAAKKFRNTNAVILGLNLGGVGFLASVREPDKFFEALKKFFDGDYRLENRMMLHSMVVRDGRNVFEAHSLNEII